MYFYNNDPNDGLKLDQLENHSIPSFVMDVVANFCCVFTELRTTQFVLKIQTLQFQYTVFLHFERCKWHCKFL